MPRRNVLFFSIAVLVAAAVLAVVSLTYRGSWGPPPGSGTALVGGPFQLTDQMGKPVTEKDFRGKYMLVFFGYTYCPDVCPTELQVMMAALDQMGPKASTIQPVFITVDPERDTAEVMQSYVENFGPALVGLTGTPAQIADVARSYRVYYAKTGGSDPDAYLMDHSSIIYLMGPEGQFVKHFTYTTDAAKLAAELSEIVSASL